MFNKVQPPPLNEDAMRASSHEQLKALNEAHSGDYGQYDYYGIVQHLTQRPSFHIRKARNSAHLQSDKAPRAFFRESEAHTIFTPYGMNLLESSPSDFYLRRLLEVETDAQWRSFLEQGQNVTPSLSHVIQDIDKQKWIRDSKTRHVTPLSYGLYSLDYGYFLFPALPEKKIPQLFCKTATIHPRGLEDFKGSDASAALALATNELGIDCLLLPKVAALCFHEDTISILSNYCDDKRNLEPVHAEATVKAARDLEQLFTFKTKDGRVVRERWSLEHYLHQNSALKHAMDINLQTMAWHYIIEHTYIVMGGIFDTASSGNVRYNSQIRCAVTIDPLAFCHTSFARQEEWPYYNPDAAPYTLNPAQPQKGDWAYNWNDLEGPTRERI